MPKIPPNINNLATVAGVVSTILKPTPVGVAMTAGNLISNATTGKTITEHVVDAVANSASSSPQTKNTPTKPNRNAVGDAVRQAKMMRGIAPQTREAASTVNPTFARGDFDRAPNSRGGVVSYKSVFDME